MILPALWLLLGLFLVVAFFLYRRRTSAPAPAPQVDPLDRLLRSTFERSPVGIGYVDSAGTWLFVNRRLSSMLGYANVELLNVPLRMMTHADDRKREAPMLAALRAGKSSGYALVKRLQRKTGEYRTFRVQMLRCGDDQHAVYQCVLEELTHQATSMEQIVGALHGIEEAAVIHCDASGTITGWTKGAERIFGRTEAEVLGRPWHWLRGIHHTEASELLASAAQSGKLEQTITPTRPDGTQISIFSTIVPYSHMQSTGFIEICRESGSTSSFGRIAAEKQELATACESLLAKEAEQNASIAALRASNAELSRKLRVLASGIRKLLAEREAAGLGSRPRPITDPAVAPLAAAGIPETGTLDDVLRTVAEQGRTGTLQIRAADGEQRLFFDDGHLVAFSSGRKESFLGQLLVDSGVITEEQRVAALEDHRESGRPFGSSLLYLGHATAEDLAKVIRSNAQRELAESAQWASSKFAFFEGRGTERGFTPISIDILSILAETAENAQEVEATTSSGDDSGNIVPTQPDAQETANGNGHDKERYFVARANGRSSSSRSAIYHTPDCTSARSIPQKSMVRFTSVEEAQQNQYSPCKRCVTPTETRA